MRLHFTCIALLLCLYSFSQQYVESRVPTYKPERRLNIRLGGNVHAYTGLATKTPQFDQKNVSLFGEGFVGYRFDVFGYTSNFFGLFGRFGSATPDAISMMKRDGVFPLKDTTKGAYVYEIEAGFVFDDWFRFSGGIGAQNLKLPISRVKQKYFTTTAGLALRFSSFNLNANLTALFGGDYKKAVLRPSLGLAVDFRLLEMRVK